MQEQYLDTGAVRLCYEILGDRGPTVVLVMGLNLQMVWWRDDFCAGLVERGLRVVRFDNRDVGRSTSFPGGGVGRGAGGAGQFAAVLAERDRTRDLRQLDLPALVVHGDRDTVVKPTGGRATAAAIPHAELLMLKGMGHDLPRRVWPQLQDAIVRTVWRASERTAA